MIRIDNIPSLNLDRKGPVPIYEQLRAGIEMAIITGELPDGSPLPAVRRLAATLEVSPNTVVRAYRDLELEGVLRSVPKRGHFVIGAEHSDPDPQLLSLRNLIDEALEVAIASGMEPSEFLQIVGERANSRKRQRRLVAIAGYQDAMLADRVAVVAEGTRDLAVDVIALTYEELDQLSPVELDERLAKVEWIMVSVLETRHASELLGHYASRILPITRKVRDDVQAFIANQPPQSRIGVVAGAEDLITRTVASVARFHPLLVPPFSASIEDPEKVEQVIQDADVLVIGSLARPYFKNRTLSIPCIELAYIPDEAAIRRLRTRLGGSSG